MIRDFTLLNNIIAQPYVEDMIKHWNLICPFIMTYILDAIAI